MTFHEFEPGMLHDFYEHHRDRTVIIDTSIIQDVPTIIDREYIGTDTFKLLRAFHTKDPQKTYEHIKGTYKIYFDEIEYILGQGALMMPETLSQIERSIKNTARQHETRKKDRRGIEMRHRTSLKKTRQQGYLDNILSTQEKQLRDIRGCYARQHPEPVFVDPKGIASTLEPFFAELHQEATKERHSVTTNTFSPMVLAQMIAYGAYHGGRIVILTATSHFESMCMQNTPAVEHYITSALQKTSNTFHAAIYRRKYNGSGLRTIHALNIDGYFTKSHIRKIVQK